MNRIKLFKKFLMPSGLCAAVPLAKSEEKLSVSDVNNANANDSEHSKLSPYYRPAPRRVTIENEEPSRLEENVGILRRSIQDKLKVISTYKNTISNTIDVGYAHTKETFNYLKDESNTLPRIGAVGVGGLSGLILGLRGGKLKKLVFSSTGALVVGSICYPNKFENGCKFIKYYVTVGYNFVRGVKSEENNNAGMTLLDLKNLNFSRVSDTFNNSSLGLLVHKIKKVYDDFAATPVPPGEKKSKEN
ncbi:PREDICTED: MICOS complex subunit MIC27 [Ceratosolen solmsi marchali]|uniref:MICOS complex subunit n=1 Tax=Ceratosolen solmsi marchali TaxID=326594 RepID=A0AAJ7E369_9HYME|nr:PREDICTED: MICOS complex subunit MIC27 [Ceratosolen solmsi marchali]